MPSWHFFPPRSIPERQACAEHVQYLSVINLKWCDELLEMNWLPLVTIYKVEETFFVCSHTLAPV